MKKILFGLSLLASAAAASAAGAEASFPVCVSFSNFCDAMQYDSKKSATWRNYDCGGSAGAQTKAKYKKGTTFCDGAKGCNPAAFYGWDSFSWEFNWANSTGTLSGVSGGTTFILQQDTPIAVTAGACAVVEGGVSSLAR